MRTAFALWVVGLGLASPIYSASAGADRGARVAAICSPCHRLEGRGARQPSIVGLEPDRFVRMMHAFKSDDAPNHIMHAVTLSLSDEEVTALAQYLAALQTDPKQP